MNIGIGGYYTLLPMSIFGEMKAIEHNFSIQKLRSPVLLVQLRVLEHTLLIRTRSSINMKLRAS